MGLQPTTFRFRLAKSVVEIQEQHEKKNGYALGMYTESNIVRYTRY